MWGRLVVLLALMGSAGAQEVNFREIHSRRVMMVEGSVNGRRANLIVDTGAESTVVSPEMAGLNEVELMKARFSSQGPGLRGEAVMDEAEVRLTSDRRVRLNVVVMRMENVSKEYGVKVDGLIGQDLLSLYGTVAIDYKNKKIRFGD
jgi:hypothetical protein